MPQLLNQTLEIDHRVDGAGTVIQDEGFRDPAGADHHVIGGPAGVAPDMRFVYWNQPSMSMTALTLPALL